MSAESEAQQTSITWDEFLLRIRANDRYAYKQTHWYKAGLELEQSKYVDPGPSLASLAQRVVFTAWNPAAGLRAPAGSKIAFSADPAYSGGAGAATSARALGHPVAAWGNQNQIGADRLTSFASTIGANYIIWQAETADEYVSAIANGAKVIVGNPNAWTDEQRTDATSRVNGAELAVMFEVYTNAGGPWPEAASAGGVPVASEVLGVGWGPWPIHLSDYQPHTPESIWQTKGVYLAENMTASDWALF